MMTDPEVAIEVVAKHTPLAVFLYLTKFVIEVDGNLHEGGWGNRAVTVAPGPHTVRMWFRYLGRPCGKADVSVNVAAGSKAVISYRAPIAVFSPGKVNVQ
jgi:hypothetical protein